MRQARNTTKTSSCLICHAEARIINYGALSCYSCKTFFRRHSFHTKDIDPCSRNGRCKITVETRRCCTACRLSKCFAMGMSKELIRKEYRTSTEPNIKPMSIASINSLSLLKNDQSSLNESEWTLLSNVIHAFDKCDLIPVMRRIIKCLDSTESTIEIDVLDSFNLFVSFYISVQSFISVTADFRVLTIAEQRSLFQRNLHGLFNLCSTYMLRDGGIFDNCRNERVILPLHGHEMVHEAKRIAEKFDFDSTLIKIMHMIFAFSTNIYTVNYDPNMNTDALLIGTFRLVGSQNVYAEILWKYMIYRYGYEEASLRFAALVKQMLDLIVLSTKVYRHNRLHQILVDDLVEQAKVALTIDDKDMVPLWEKAKSPTIEENKLLSCE